MNRTVIAELDEAGIARSLKASGVESGWTRLAELAADEAAWLLKLVCRLDPPDRIAELRGLEAEQCERGAGFLGMLPDQIPDDLGAPSDLETSLDVAIRLAQIRTSNLRSLVRRDCRLLLILKSVSPPDPEV